MTLTSFDNFCDYCKICNDKMVLIAEFDILIHRHVNGNCDFDMAGIISFIYEGNGKFERFDIIDEADKIVMDFADKKFINSFTIKKRLYPNLGKSKLFDEIFPIEIDAVPMTLVKQCLAPNTHHNYGYRTSIINETDSVKTPGIFDVETEFVQAYGYSMSNVFENTKPKYTTIAEFGNDGTGQVQKKNYPKLPPVEVSYWDISSKENIKNQVDRLSLLV